MKLDIDEIDLQLLFGLDTDEKGGTTTGGDDLIREMNGFEDECKGALEFL